MNKKVIFTIVILFFQILTAAFSQTKGLTDSVRYKYPLSLGIEYNSLLALKEIPFDYNFIFFNTEAVIRAPLNILPMVQPYALIGISQASGSQNTAALEDLVLPDNDRYDHTTFYAGTGVGLSYMFSRYFEAGIYGGGGFGYSRYPFIFENENPRGTLLYYGEAGLTVSINPTYNLSITLSPGIQYETAIHEIYQFNGLSAVLGGSINFRFGDDPDLANRILKSLKISSIETTILFAAMQSYYGKNPVGTVTVANTEKGSLKDVQVSFYQAGFMDSPTPSAEIEELLPGESRTIPLYANFNGEIFNTEGVIPLTGEIIITYTYNGDHGEQKTSMVYDLYDKTSITWDDDRKVAAFITPADGQIKKLFNYIFQTTNETRLPALNQPLQTAVNLFSALKELGCLYRIDPQSPFSKVHGNKLAVDYVNLPRETLSAISGDCDDLTVLYLSLLEAAGVETAFITLPGHIFPAFNTGIDARNYRELHPDRGMTFAIKGKLWLPVEITLLEDSTFLEAWKTASDEFNSMDKNPEKRGVYITREAQEIYRPVGLKKSDEVPFLNSLNNYRLVSGSRENLKEITGIISGYYEKLATDSGDKKDFNKAGIVLAGFNETEKAEKAFLSAISKDADYTKARINLGTLYFQQEKYLSALELFEGLLASMNPEDPVQAPQYARILLRVSLVHYRLKNYEQSKALYEKLNEISPDHVNKYDFLNIDTAEKSAGPEQILANDLFGAEGLYLEDNSGLN